MDRATCTGISPDSVRVSLTMSLLETLALGSYLYTTAVFVFLFRLIRNHWSHRVRTLEDRVSELESLRQ